jgi:predicted transcriptional regulator
VLLKIAIQRYHEQQTFWVWEIYYELCKQSHKEQLKVLHGLDQARDSCTIKSLAQTMQVRYKQIERTIIDLWKYDLLIRIKAPHTTGGIEYTYTLSELGKRICECDAAKRNGYATPLPMPEPIPEPIPEPMEGQKRRKYMKIDWERLMPEIIHLEGMEVPRKAIAKKLDVEYHTLTQYLSRRRRQKA